MEHFRGETRPTSIASFRRSGRTMKDERTQDKEAQMNHHIQVDPIIRTAVRLK